MRGPVLRITSSLLWICLIAMLMASCMPFSPSTSSNLTTFVDDGNIYNGGKWSPDGHWFAAGIFPSDTIHIFSSDGQAKGVWQSGCDLGGSSTEFSWSADGRLSCFLEQDPTALKLVTLDQNGQVKQSTQIIVPIPATLTHDFAWNPQHNWLATLVDSRPGDPRTRVDISDLAGHRLIQPLNIDGEQLAWSADGTTLAITQLNGDVLLLSMQQTGPEKVNIVKTHLLAAGTAPDETVAWSPSGHWLVCRHGSYESEDYLFLLATDGSGKRVKLTSSTTDGQLAFPAWSPDGKHLIVATVSPSANVLLSLDIATLLKEKGVKL